MKIAVTVTLDVDPATWAAEYGTGTGRQAVRDDVLAHLRNTVREHYVTRLAVAREARVVIANGPRMSASPFGSRR